MYASETGGRLPAKASRVRSFMVAYATVFPEYMTDISVLVCPSDSTDDAEDLVKIQKIHSMHQSDDLLSVSWSYVYTGFATIGESDWAGWRCYIKTLNDTLNEARGQVNFRRNVTIPSEAVWPRDGDPYGQHPQIKGTGSSGKSTLYTLKKGVEGFLITDINSPAESATSLSPIPVMWDLFATESSVFNHLPGGANVLYLDGHVEFIKYPGNYPVTRWVASSQSRPLFGGVVTSEENGPRGPWW
jgi:prepilin-type processing-associated H-X9-DG protein